jgi:hypothetical protein
MLDAVLLLVLVAAFPAVKTGFQELFCHLMSGIQL